MLTIAGRTFGSRLILGTGGAANLTVLEEALRGATVHAARALGLADRGTLSPGQRADFVVWDIEAPVDLCYWIGGSLARRVVAGGLRRVG